MTIPNTELADSSWNKYVYRIYSGTNVDFDRCTTMCAFDYPNVDGSNCHFLSFESNICYLGSLAEERDLLANTMSTTLYLKTGKKMSIRGVDRSPSLCISDVLATAGLLLSKFPTTTTITEAKQAMVFQVFNGLTYTEDICASLCYTHNPSTPACHFFSVMSGVGCILGNYNHNGSMTLQNLANPITAYFNESTWQLRCIR